MSNNVSEKTKKTVISAIICAFGVIVLYIGAVVDVLDLSVAALSSFGCVFAVIEFGGMYPWLVWTVTSALSLLLLPQKFPAVLYFLFAGIYPILKAKFERLHFAWAWTLKLSLFNVALFLTALTVKYVFITPDAPVSLSWIAFALGNITFILYDIALSKIILLYIVKIRKKLKLHKMF